MSVNHCFGIHWYIYKYVVLIQGNIVWKRTDLKWNINLILKLTSFSFVLYFLMDISLKGWIQTLQIYVKAAEYLVILWVVIL